jgi:hypothetical protein
MAMEAPSPDDSLTESDFDGLEKPGQAEEQASWVFVSHSAIVSALCSPTKMGYPQGSHSGVFDSRSAPCWYALTKRPMEASRVVNKKRERRDSASSGSMSALLHTSSTTMSAALLTMVVRYWFSQARAVS